MFKNVSYNQLKLIRFVTFLFGIIVSLAYMFLIDYVPQNIGNVIAFLRVAGSLLILLSVLLFTVKISSKKGLQDETSRENDKEANTFTLLIIQTLVCILLMVTIFTEVSVTLNGGVGFLCFAALNLINDGCYLYLERRDMKDAGIDDED